jgi:aryl-alcohol dehydrogenase-like predicted oxidoreductase
MSITQANQQRALGGSGILVPALGLGTNRWGAGRGKNNAAIFETFQTYLDTGQAFFDTAEVYTGGKSERLLGDCLRRDNRPVPVIISSKFAPLPNRLSPHSLMDALDASLKRLEVETIDLYHVHWPFTFLRIDALMDMMALAVRTGKIRAVGVSNYNASQMRQAAARLTHYEIPLASNEVHYSLLHRQPETNGVLTACRELNVALIAWRPLEGGKLKIQTHPASTATKPVRGKPSSSKSDKQEQLANLQHTLSTIAAAREKTVSQVALNWLLLRDEHVIPIPGATTSQHLLENLGALGWQLSDEEFTEIDRASSPWKK